MSTQRVFRLLVPTALLLLGLLLSPLAALADEDREAKADGPKLKVKVRKQESKAAEAPRAQRSPSDTVHRWLMGEMQKWGKAPKDAPSPLHAWFDGGKDVPLAGLRDALRADGWTADQLMRWLQQHATAAVHSMWTTGPHMFGNVAEWSSPWRYGSRMRGMPRGFGMRGPRARRFGPGMGWGGRSRFGGGGPFAGFSPWGHQWGGARGPFGGRMGGGMPGRGGPPGWSGMAGGPVQQQSRTIILWNDGTGWKRQEIPGGDGGFAGGAWMGMGPGGPPWGPMHGGRGGQQPDMHKLFEWLQQMKPGAPGQAPQGAGANPQAWMEFFRRMHPGSEAPPPGFAEALEKMFPGGVPPHGVKHKIRVKSVTPRQLEIIEEEVEPKIEEGPKK